MSISKINTLTQRTLVNSDVMQIADSAGAAWYKTSLAKLAEFLYLAYFSIANTWTAKQTFSAGAAVANGSAAGDAVNKGQLDLMLPKAGGTMSGIIAMGSQKITGLANGTAAGDAVNKGQLDGKQDKITGTTDRILKKTASGVSDSILGVSSTINAINIPELATAPDNTADPMGAVGDLGWWRGALYWKTGTGWYKVVGTTF